MRSLPLLLTVLLVGCGSVPPATPTLPPPRTAPLPTLTPAPSPTATPAPALDATALWVAVEGFSTAVAEVQISGAVTVVDLPLNEGQRASNVIATADRLLYLVWGADGQQVGIASWDVTESAARFVITPLDGYRIIYMLMGRRGESFVYVQVEDDGPPSAARWQLDVAPVTGGRGQTVITSEDLTGLFPPEPVGWPVDGPILLNAATPEGTSQGVYAVNPSDGTNRVVLPPEADELILTPRLSPDSTQLAYLTYEPDLLPAAARSTAPTNVVKVHDLRLNETISMPPGRGQAVYGVRWAGDGRLLLDVVTFTEGDAPHPQTWSVVGVGEEPPWESSPSGPERAFLFDYQPLGDGVIYTVLPEWRLYILPTLEAEVEAISLELLAQAEGAPRILRTP